MGERKVLNKYYPPDFDTVRLPKLPGGRPDQYVIRIMAPFTMRCLTCGNYVYKGKKFNSRKEDAKGEKYLGIQIYRFYIRCPECLSEITFKTDPENSDYKPEHGAMRTFQAERLAELEEQKETEEKEEEETNNPILALENRTAESRMEMDILDALEEIKDWNARNASVKHEHLLEGLIGEENKVLEERETALTELASRAFAEKRDGMRRLADEDAPPTKQPRLERGPQQTTTNTQKQKLSQMVVRRKKVSSGPSARAGLEERVGASAGLGERERETVSADRSGATDGGRESSTSSTSTSGAADGGANTNYSDPTTASGKDSVPSCTIASSEPAAVQDSRVSGGGGGGGGLGLLSGYSDSSNSGDSD